MKIYDKRIELLKEYFDKISPNGDKEIIDRQHKRYEKSALRDDRCIGEIRIAGSLLRFYENKICLEKGKRKKEITYWDYAWGYCTIPDYAAKGTDIDEKTLDLLLIKMYELNHEPFKAYMREINRIKYKNGRKVKLTREMQHKINEISQRGWLLSGDPIEPFRISWNGSGDELKEICYGRAKEIYGNSLPIEVSKRIEYELTGIINNGYAESYLRTKELIDKSGFERGEYLIKGTAGNSLTAFLCGLTETNPIMPNHISLNPAFYLGLDTNKEPIWEIAIRKDREREFIEAAKSLEGIRDVVYIDMPYEETGDKHIFLVPDTIENLDYYLPIKSKDDGEYHFDCYLTELSDVFPKITFTLSEPHMLAAKASEYSRKELGEIDTADDSVISVFQNCESIGLDAIKNRGFILDTRGIPGFKGGLGAEILLEARPKDFHELALVYSLLSGAGTWTDNAKSLMNSKTAGIDEVITDRDSLFDNLISYGVDEQSAFIFTERVRKGKGLTHEQEKELADKGIPQWYMDSCNKIKYLPARAQSLGYTLLAWRIAYYKLHHPKAFYKAYLEVYGNDNSEEIIAEMSARGITL